MSLEEVIIAQTGRFVHIVNENVQISSIYLPDYQKISTFAPNFGIYLLYITFYEVENRCTCQTST